MRTFHFSIMESDAVVAAFLCRCHATALHRIQLVTLLKHCSQQRLPSSLLAADSCQVAGAHGFVALQVATSNPTLGPRDVHLQSMNALLHEQRAEHGSNALEAGLELIASTTAAQACVGSGGMHACTSLFQAQCNKRAAIRGSKMRQWRKRKVQNRLRREIPHYALRRINLRLARLAEQV